MDGDLQNDPADIPLMLAKLNEGYDAVLGQREKRTRQLLLREVPSLMGNWLIRKVLGCPSRIRLHAARGAPRGVRRAGALRRNASLHHRAHHATGATVAQMPVGITREPRGSRSTTSREPFA